MMKLYLTRHGQTQWNMEKRFQGHKDSPLTELGIKQAQWLGEALKDEKFDAIYSSSIFRAFHTADLIRGERNIEIRKLEALKEMSFGKWEGMQIEVLKHTYSEELDRFWHAPHLYTSIGGETFEDVRRRVIPAVDEIIKKHKNETVLVVVHGIVLKLIMASFENITMENLWESPVASPTSLSMIDIDENKADVIMKYNTSHYKE